MPEPARCCTPTHRWTGYQFSSNGEELSRLLAQVHSEIKGKAQMIIELMDTIDELDDAVAKRGRHAQRCQAKLEDQVWQQKEEQERLCARLAA